MNATGDGAVVKNKKTLKWYKEEEEGGGGER